MFSKYGDFERRGVRLVVFRGNATRGAVERARSGTERRRAVVASRAAGDKREKSQAVCDCR